jgi:hypothetical protein
MAVNVLLVENSPPTLNAAKLLVLPLLIEHFEEKVFRSVFVGCTNERVKEDL